MRGIGAGVARQGDAGGRRQLTACCRGMRAHAALRPLVSAPCAAAHSCIAGAGKTCALGKSMHCAWCCRPVGDLHGLKHGLGSICEMIAGEADCCWCRVWLRSPMH